MGELFVAKGRNLRRRETINARNAIFTRREVIFYRGIAHAYQSLFFIPVKPDHDLSIFIGRLKIEIIG